MRILHVLPSLDQNHGGPLRAVLDLSVRACSLGLESEVLGVGDINVPDNPLAPELIHAVPLGCPAIYRYSPEIEAWLYSNLVRFDGVVIHGMWLHPGVAVMRACDRLKKPFVCFPHGMLEPWCVFGQSWWKAAKKLLYWALRERKIIKHAHAVLYTTERERRLSQSTFHITNPSSIVVPYGLDLRQSPASDPENASLFQPSSSRIALFLGRVHPKKNVLFLINTWAAAHPPDNWKLVIAGPSKPEYLSRVQRAIELHKLERQISIVGSVSGQDKRYLLSRADWFLLPSSQENFGIAVLEAIGAGCAVAVSDQVYVADQFHPQSEIIPLRAEAWISFMRERMLDPRHREKLVALDRAHVLPHFEINEVSRRWVREIRTVFTN